MPIATPFTGPADLSTAYGIDDGHDAGSFRATIPDNFQKIKNEILNAHSRLLALEGANTAALVTRLPASVNETFQVRRWGPQGFQHFAGSNTQFRWRPGAFVSPYTDGNGNGRVTAGVGGHYDYVQSLFAGWFIARNVFSDLGQEVVAGQQIGARFTFNDGMTYYNSLQPSVVAGYAVSGAGDLPAIYQPLTRHLPIELLRYQPLNIRLRYAHAAAIPSAVTYRLYISWSDGTKRYDSVSPVLASTSGIVDVLWGTGSDTAMFPGGLIPGTATSVEVGLVQASRSGTYGTDAWDLYGFMVDVGSPRNEVSVTPWPVDFVRCARTYAQTLGGDITGRSYAMDHPLIQAGATVPTAGTITLEEHYPWPLCVPWRRATTSLVPNCRVQEIVGAVADGVDPTYLLHATNDTASISVSDVGYDDSSEPFDQRGLITALDRKVEAAPAGSSQMLRRIDMPLLKWFGELSCAISPIGY